ncbi:MAG TPA: tetratricopeptide repeat protein [Streptosporangiaceae bacterium]|jgi:Flp pilus assembly protein TadD
MTKGSSDGRDSRSGPGLSGDPGDRPGAGADEGTAETGGGGESHHAAGPHGAAGAPDAANAQDAISGHSPKDAAHSPLAGDAAGADTYALYQRGLELLGRGSAAAAAQLLERAARAEPHSRSVLEALGRAQFDAGQHDQSAASFQRIVDVNPSDDYAQFGLGLALSRTGDFCAAAEHLALAAAMRPDLRHYTDALRSVRATLRARSAPSASAQGDHQRGQQGD